MYQLNKDFDPLLSLHFLQANNKLFKLFVPCCERAITWSIVRKIGLSLQYAQQLLKSLLRCTLSAWYLCFGSSNSKPLWIKLIAKFVRF